MATVMVKLIFFKYVIKLSPVAKGRCLDQKKSNMNLEHLEALSRNKVCLAIWFLVHPIMFRMGSLLGFSLPHMLWQRTLVLAVSPGGLLWPEKRYWGFSLIQIPMGTINLTSVLGKCPWIIFQWGLIHMYQQGTMP